MGIKLSVCPKNPLTHIPIVGDARVGRSVPHARRRGHVQEVATVAAVAAAAGVGRHLEVRSLVVTKGESGARSALHC